MDSRHSYISTMNRVVLIGSHITKLSWTYGSRVWMSSLVEISANSQYKLPLILLPTTPLPLKRDTYDFPRMQPPGLYRVTNMQVIPVPAWHVITSPIKPSTLSSKDYLPPSILLQSGVNEQSSESPKPDKPKWEEEQYPDIGKSISPLNSLS